MTEKQWSTLAEVASRLGVTKQTVVKYLATVEPSLEAGHVRREEGGKRTVTLDQAAASAVSDAMARAAAEPGARLKLAAGGPEAAGAVKSGDGDSGSAEGGIGPQIGSQAALDAIERAYRAALDAKDSEIASLREQVRDLQGRLDAATARRGPAGWLRGLLGPGEK